MPDIQAFRGIRYDLGRVGSLSDVIAPPYDVIDADLQNTLYEKNPANVVRLILNREEEGDDDKENRYLRAARFKRDWLRDGVLAADPAPAIYVYHQLFDYAGQRFCRRGFMCRVRLEPFGTGKIYPHEQTHPGPKADRLKLMTACRANLSQIFGIFPDEQNETQSLLESAIKRETPLEAFDHLGVTHRLWVLTDEQTISHVSGVMAPKPIYVADGHHRYETACTYRDQLPGGQSLDPEHPANFVLMCCVGMSDPGMIVLPTHRLFRGVPELAADELVAKLGNYFAVELTEGGPESTDDLWQRIELENEQGTVALYSQVDQRWVLARITETGRARIASLAPNQSDDWRSLGVSILHKLVMDDLLGLTDLPKPKYVHAVEEVVDGLKQGDSVGRDATGQQASGGKFNLAALVMPATLEHVRAISEHGERMPAKSTYFYPKLLSGLVLNPLQ